MKIFKNKFLVKLIATICLFLTLLNFCGANKVYANEEASLGGVLISPIVHLMTGIGDAIMDILHRITVEQEVTMIRIDGNKNWWSKIATLLAIAIGIFVAVAAIGAVVAVGAAVAGFLAEIGVGLTMGAVFSLVPIAGGTLAGGAVLGTVVGFVANDWMTTDDLYLPMFSITAEEIFAGRLPLFDVNFFNPMENAYTNVRREVTEAEIITIKVANDGSYNATKQNRDPDYLRSISSVIFHKSLGGQELSTWSDSYEPYLTNFKVETRFW